ncbi:MAG: hypothetical protein QM778_28755 [Myxococcales bacterium]
MAPKPSERFRVLMERVFSAKTERMADQMAFTRKYPDLFKAEYDEARRIVFSTQSGAVLWDLMKAYLNTYGNQAANPNAIHYYKSDQLYQFLIEQSAKVDDESLFETWSGFFKSDPDTDSFNSFRKRYVDLDVSFRSALNVFIAREREKRRNRRSLLDVLRDEYQRVNKRKPTDAELWNFDPRPSFKKLIEIQVDTVRRRWRDARKDASEDNVKAFQKALGDLREWFRTTGNGDLLRLFQAVKDVQITPDMPSMADDQTVLYYGIYGIACVQLYASGLGGKTYQKNRFGFTKEELVYFTSSVEKSSFLYKSNITHPLGSVFKDLMAPIGAIAGFLSTYLITQTRLRGLSLVPLDFTLKIQKKWENFNDITDLLGLAARNSNPPGRITAIMSDPRNTAAVADMRELGSSYRKFESGPELAKGTIKAGSRVGRHNQAGAISVVYIHPQDNRVFVELSGFKPQLFHATDAWVIQHLYGQKLVEIHENTIGMVHLTQLMFMAMGFLPTLIEAGFVGLIYEIALTYTTGKLEEQLEKIDPTLAKILGLAIGLFAPRPHFGPKLKGAEVLEQADNSLLADTVNFKPKDRGIHDNAASAENRGTGRLNDQELDEFMAKLEIGDEYVTNNMGVPLSRADINKYMGALKAPKGRGPIEWREAIRDSPPLRKLIEAVQKDPEGKIKLARISDKQGKLLHYKYQKSSMGSEYELHLTLNGKEYKLDGVIKGADDTWWIGESKFTYKDMLEKAMANLKEKAGNKNPTTSYHFQAVNDVVKQFEGYAALAKQYGFDGLAVMTNTEFLWATFEQTTRRFKNIEVILSRLEEEMPEFAGKSSWPGTRLTK